jgi:DNA-binding MarR family transcriptional regulator
MATPAQDSKESIIKELKDHPGATTVEVATALGIGKSTATRYLAELEVEGTATRVPAGWEDGRRFPDRWSAAVTATEVPASTPKTKRVDRVEAKPAANPSVDGVATDGASGRLTKGVLAALVLDYLAAQPTESFGPSAIGKALDRSGGAVSNALAKMAAQGEVDLVGEKPRRYRISPGK